MELSVVGEGVPIAAKGFGQAAALNVAILAVWCRITSATALTFQPRTSMSWTSGKHGRLRSRTNVVCRLMGRSGASRAVFRCRATFPSYGLGIVSSSNIASVVGVGGYPARCSRAQMVRRLLQTEIALDRCTGAKRR